MVEYMFRGHAMKRAPKREYYVPGEEPPVYKWGQQKIHYPDGSEYSGLPMPDWMVMLKDKINMDFGANVNHAIIIKYSDGVQHHAPPHQDKIPDGTEFFVLSFGEPRMFQMINSENEVVWCKYLGGPNDNMAEQPKETPKKPAKKGKGSKGGGARETRTAHISKEICDLARRIL